MRSTPRRPIGSGSWIASCHPVRRERRPRSSRTSSAQLPQVCLRQDRLSLLEQEGRAEEDAIANELRHGMTSLQAGALEGAQRFASGEGRHGASA